MNIPDNPFKKLQDAITNDVPDGIQDTLHEIAGRMVARIKQRILTNQAPWGEGIDPDRAARQLAESVTYRVQNNSIVILFEGGTHEETGLPIPQVAQMREFGTSTMETAPSVMPEVGLLRANRKIYAKQVGEAASKVMKKQ